MDSILRPCLVSFGLLTLATGVAYPALVTAVARAFFPWQAEGSLIRVDDQVVGSALIGQPFRDPGRFWSRPSATPGMPYDASASSGSNLGPSNPALHEAVRARIEALRQAGAPDGPVPADLVTTSGSGLDPHLSPAAAYHQAARVARARGLSEAVVRQVIADRVKGRDLGFLGEPRISVLELNLAIDRITAVVTERAGS